MDSIGNAISSLFSLHDAPTLEMSPVISNNFDNNSAAN
jgi:hypothetical protein